MKKLRNAAAIIALTAVTMFGSAPAASAAIVAPTHVPHGTLYDCQGPYYKYTYGGYYYNCYADYDWFAEVFLGQDDMRVIVRAWYTA